LIALLLVSYGAVFVAAMSSEALGVFKAYFFEPIIFFILVINILGKEKKASEKIIWSMLISALLVSVVAIYQKITGQFIFNEFWANEATRRSVSFFGYPNAVGLYLAPIVVILSSFLHQKLFYITENKQKNIREIIIISVTIIASLLAIYFAQSEGALIGILAAAIFYGLLINKKMRQVTVVTLVVGLMIIVSTPKLLYYAKHKITLTDLSGQIRQQQWTETKKLLLHDYTWVLGAGLSQYQKRVLPYHQEGIFVKNDDPNWLEKVRTSAEYRTQVWQPTEVYMYPHNIFLNFWTELGLLGMLIFTWIIGKYVYCAIKLFGAEKAKKSGSRFIVLGLGAAMVATLVHGLVDVPYFKNDLSVFFWLLVAFLGMYWVDYKNKR
jgi:O-antigen ligase